MTTRILEPWRPASCRRTDLRRTYRRPKRIRYERPPSSIGSLARRQPTTPTRTACRKTEGRKSRTASPKERWVDSWMTMTRMKMKTTTTKTRTTETAKRASNLCQGFRQST
uniref:(northern house mosquito) hypothetical protein n=1 Tax=Culex pipiens TaxID=7175 RepID=A0A8D8BA35_CULPI